MASIAKALRAAAEGVQLHLVLQGAKQDGDAFAPDKPISIDDVALTAISAFSSYIEANTTCPHCLATFMSIRHTVEEIMAADSPESKR